MEMFLAILLALLVSALVLALLLRLPSKMMFMGCWLRYSGLYPSYQVRLGHRDRFRFKQFGHGQRVDLYLIVLKTRELRAGDL